MKVIESFHDLEQTFVIAEIGGNHEGDLGYAKKLLKDAAESGADAVKFQSYSPERLVSQVEDPARFQHFGKFSLSTEMFLELKAYADDLQIHFMTSIWDDSFLSQLDAQVPIHKVGSGDLTNYYLLEKFVRCNKPLIISTAMATMSEVEQTLAFITSVDQSFIQRGMLAVLHCVAMYGDPQDQFANLNVIKTFLDAFPGVTIGYSDHTLGSLAALISVGLGAKILELHFTDDKSRDFRDHHISVDRLEMTALIDQIRRVEAMLGDSEKKPVSEVETSTRITEFRRACYPRRDIKRGETITETDLVTLRPARV